MNNIIEVKNLTKTFVHYKKEPGLWEAFKSVFVRKKINKIVVDKISFEIDEGEFVGFLGPNGAGKTTTIKMLSGILYPTSGDIHVMGKIPQERNNELLRSIGIVMGQKSQLFWDIPPLDSLMMFREIYQIPEVEFNKRLHELSTVLEVKDALKNQYRKLSLGQRMKCEIIAAIIHKPKVLFLDEPTIGLDVVAKKNMWDFLKSYNQKEKCTIMLTSHYMEDIKQLCKRVIIIDKGKLVYDDEFAKLNEKYLKYKTITLVFPYDAKREEVAGFGKILEIKESKVVLKVPKDKASKIAEEILKKYKINDILISAPEAEEVIREIFSKNAKK